MFFSSSSFSLSSIETDTGYDTSLFMESYSMPNKAKELLTIFFSEVSFISGTDNALSGAGWKNLPSFSI